MSWTARDPSDPESVESARLLNEIAPNMSDEIFLEVTQHCTNVILFGEAIAAEMFAATQEARRIMREERDARR